MNQHGRMDFDAILIEAIRGWIVRKPPFQWKAGESGLDDLMASHFSTCKHIVLYTYTYYMRICIYTDQCSVILEFESNIGRVPIFTLAVKILDVQHFRLYIECKV